MLRPSALSVKGAVGFSDLLNVSVTAGSTVGLGIGIEGVGRKRFGITTHPRKWLRVNEAGKLNYITVRPCLSHSLTDMLPLLITVIRGLALSHSDDVLK